MDDCDVAAAVLLGNFSEFKYLLSGRKDITFQRGLCEWNGADECLERFGQAEFWVPGFCHPHGASAVPACVPPIEC